MIYITSIFSYGSILMLNLKIISLTGISYRGKFIKELQIAIKQQFYQTYLNEHFRIYVLKYQWQYIVFGYFCGINRNRNRLNGIRFRTRESYLAYLTHLRI